MGGHIVIGFRKAESSKGVNKIEGWWLWEKRDQHECLEKVTKK
jgi:hypothetical protein